MTTAAVLAQMGATNQTFRNRIQNGSMIIDQRNAGASVNPANGAYTLDRWGANMFVNASKFTVQQYSPSTVGYVTPPSGFTNYLGVVSSSAYAITTNDIYTIFQGIEGYNVADLGWGAAGAATVTLSFWVRSSLTGTFGAVLHNSGSTRTYPFTYVINSANTWEQKTITVVGDTTGTWEKNSNCGIYLRFGLGVGATYSAAAGSWTGGPYYSATGATSVVGTNGATFYITGVQLEAGTKATPFEQRSYGTELALCQRYYQIKTAAVTTTSAFQNIHFMTQLRAAATNITTTFDGGTGATFISFGGGPATNALYQNTNHSQTATATIKIESEL